MDLKNEWSIRRIRKRPDGSTVICSVAGKMDLATQVRSGTVRYEIFDAGGKLIHTEAHAGKQRLYNRFEFELMLEKAGFREVTCTGGFTEEPYGDGHESMMFRAVK